MPNIDFSKPRIDIDDLIRDKDFPGIIAYWRDSFEYSRNVLDQFANTDLPVYKRLNDDDFPLYIYRNRHDDDESCKYYFQKLTRASLLAIDPWVSALGSTDYLIRHIATRMLGRLNNHLAVEPLIVILRDVHWLVRCDAAISLGELNDTRAVEPLISLFSNDDSPYSRCWRITTATVLSKLGDARAVAPLERALLKIDKGDMLMMSW